MTDKQTQINKFLADLINQAFILREYNPGSQALKNSGLKIPVEIPIELVESAFDLLPKDIRKSYFFDKAASSLDPFGGECIFKLESAPVIDSDGRTTVQVRINKFD